MKALGEKGATRATHATGQKRIFLRKIPFSSMVRMQYGKQRPDHLIFTHSLQYIENMTVSVYVLFSY